MKRPRKLDKSVRYGILAKKLALCITGNIKNGMERGEEIAKSVE